jgi:virginiamycin A acetyltransferase
MSFPLPDTAYPVTQPGGTVHRSTVFLCAVIDHPRWEIGEYSYASAHHPPADWAAHLAPYLYDFSPEKLVIGKFCQIADGVQFITSSANHRRDGISTYPFAIFHGRFENAPSLPGPGPDTVIGHDVWIGQGARILPGARIGDGVIVGAGAVVGGTVAPYQVVAGNPARVISERFPVDVAAQLQQIAWWDWPIEMVERHEVAICGANLARLQAAQSEIDTA